MKNWWNVADYIFDILELPDDNRPNYLDVTVSSAKFGKDRTFFNSTFNELYFYDTDPDYMFSQGSLLTCMACGEYFERHSSRQRYCDNPNCQAERNNRKAREYYKRKHTRNN